jgi:hypothetical protein
MSRLLDQLTFGAARRRRRMAKLLAQLDNMPMDTLPTGGRPSYRPPQGHKLPGFRVVATLMVWVLIIGGVVYLVRSGGSSKPSGASSTPAPNSAPTSAGAQDAIRSPKRQITDALGVPVPGTDEARTRILPAPAIPAGNGGYKYLIMDKTSPVAYDPCRPIHYVIRNHDTPVGGNAAVHVAIAAASKATGLKFIDDGLTEEKPTLDRKAYQPARYGDRWAPVLIAWSDPTELPYLGEGDTVGAAVSYLASAPATAKAHGRVYVTGDIALDAADFTRLAKGPRGSAAMIQGIEHELGHLVGLDHVLQTSQLMYPRGQKDVLTYQAGDLRGLAQLGRGSCHPEV